MHLVADLLTGEELDLDQHGKSCNQSGYIRAISDLVDPLLSELQSCKAVIDSHHFPHYIESIDNIISDVEGKIQDKKAEIRGIIN